MQNVQSRGSPGLELRTTGIVGSVGHFTLKKVISYFTSYFSQILTELHHYK